MRTGGSGGGVPWALGKKRVWSSGMIGGRKLGTVTAGSSDANGRTEGAEVGVRSLMLFRTGRGYSFGAYFAVVLLAVLFIVDFFFVFGFDLSSGFAPPALARPVFFSGATNLVFSFLASGAAAMVRG